MQFGGQFDAGRARADDSHMQTRRMREVGLSVSTDTGVDQAAIEPCRFFHGVERDRVFLRTRRAEIIGVAADGDDQRVIGDRLRGRDQNALVIMGRGHLNFALGAIQSAHRAEAKAEMMPVRLGDQIGLVLRQVHAAGGNFVQQRFPQMRARALDQGHLRRAALAQRVAQARHQLEPAGAGADHNDTMRCIGHDMIPPKAPRRC